MQQSQPPQEDHDEKINQDDGDHDDNFKSRFTPGQIKTIMIQGWLCLMGGICMHLVLGTFYLWGGISPYIASYLKQYDKDVSITTMQLVFPILGIATNSVLSFGVKTAERVGYKTTLFFGGFFISLAFLICSFITNLPGFIVCYCLLIGISSGLVYMLPIICGWKYFPFNRGRVSGMIIAGYGLGSFIFNFVCKAYVNPDDRKPDIPYVEADGKEHKYFGPDVYEKVPGMLRMLAGCYFGLTLISVFLVRYPQDLNLEYQQVLGNGKAPSGIDHKKSVDHHPTVLHAECDTLGQGIKSRPFAFLLPMILLSTIFGLFMANCYKVYGLGLGLSDANLTIIGSVHSMANALSRAMWAALMDRFGFKIVFCGIMVINLACTASMGYLGGNFWAYMIVLAITMGCEGGMFSCFPAVSAKIFGHKVGPIIYGILFFAIGCANMIAYLLYKFVTPSIGYNGLFWVFFGIKATALIVGILFREFHEWKRR